MLRRLRRWLRENGARRPPSPLEAQAMRLVAGGVSGVGVLLAALLGGVLAHQLALRLLRGDDGVLPPILDQLSRPIWVGGAAFGVAAFGGLLAGRPWGVVLACVPLLGASVAFGAAFFAPVPGERFAAAMWAAVGGAALGGLLIWPWRPQEP